MEWGTPGDRKPKTFMDIQGKLGNKIRKLIEEVKEGYWLEDDLRELVEYLFSSKDVRPHNLYIPVEEHDIKIVFALIDNDDIIIRFKDKDSEHYYLLNIYHNPFKPEVVVELTIFDCESAIFQYRWTIKGGGVSG